MTLEGKVKKGLGNASFWVEKIDKVFFQKKGMNLFYGTLNIELDNPYELQNYWIIRKEEYGGTQDVYVQEITVFNKKAYIVRAENTAHSSKIIELVSNVNLRDKFNLKDNNIIYISIN